MPTYDYQCRSCGTVTEVIHSMTEDGPTVCERCGGELRRVLYPAGIIFKGSGFYRTDSRSGSTAASKGSKDKPAASDGAAASGKPSDAGGSSSTTSPTSTPSTTGDASS